MSTSAAPTLALINGARIPQLGLGTWPMDDATAERVVASAIEVGYRLFDTAENYGNERGVGRGLRTSGVAREDVFVTTKFNKQWHSVDGARRACEASLERLGLDYLDLLLIHWPNPAQDRYVEAFGGLVALLRDGLVRAIGTSNFTPAHLQRVLDETGVTPDVNQLQLNPYVVQEKGRAFAAERGIVVQSWSPLGRGPELRSEPVVVELAQRIRRTPAQILLRWHIELDWCRCRSRRIRSGCGRTSRCSTSRSPPRTSLDSPHWTEVTSTCSTRRASATEGSRTIPAAVRWMTRWAPPPPHDDPSLTLVNPPRAGSREELVVTDPEPAPPTGQAHQVRRGEASAGDRDAVVLAQIDESFHQVGGGVVHETLLRLGHSVEIREGPHPEIYPLLGSGDVHLFATSWLPGGHGHYWAQVEDRAVAVTPLYDGARFFWAVPDYVPEQQVASLADLTRPEVVDRMATLVVQGTTPGAGLTMRSRQLVTDYGLDQLGWRYEVGDLAAIIRTIDERVASQDWFVTPLWEPQYLNRVHRLRPLDDPRGVFPPPDQAWLTANHRAFQGLPATTQAVLRKVRFDITDTTAMDHAVNVDGLSTLQAARQWMDSYPEKVRAWLG